MANNKQPIAKKSRYLGISPAVWVSVAPVSPPPSQLRPQLRPLPLLLRNTV